MAKSPDRTGKSPDRMAKPFDRTGKLPDRTVEPVDRTGKLPDRTVEPVDRIPRSTDRTGNRSDRADEGLNRITFTSEHAVKPQQQNTSSLTDMAKTDYISTSDTDFAAQLLTFKTTVGSYAATIGVTPAQVTAQAADADYFNYLLACRDVMQNGAQQWNNWKALIRAGGTPPPSGAPVIAPVFPAVVPAVAPGIETRFRGLVKLIKASPNYNEAIGDALGIEGPQQTGPDLSAIKPEIEVAISGTSVQVTWGWNGNSAFLDMCELQVDRNDNKGFVLLAFDTTPNYTDTQPFPAAPVKWTYQAIFRVGDARVGQWSKPVSVTVGG